MPKKEVKHRVPRTRCSNTMTTGQFNTFIRSVLRRASQRWKPLNEVRTEARVARGLYECNICKQHVPNSIKVGGKRVKNVIIDHTNPIVDPEVGFTTWDDFIYGLFCEKDNLQAICKSCADEKGAVERSIANERKNNDI